MAWTSGYRQSSNEQAIKRQTIDRDLGICYVCGLPGADQADHVVRVSQGGTHALGNRRAIHSDPCHKAKTHTESVAAKRPMPNRRPRERHPGLI